jgi:dynein heavy chain
LIVLDVAMLLELKVKDVQYYETDQVRHGLMVVGQTGSGKSCVMHTVAMATTKCTGT